MTWKDGKVVSLGGGRGISVVIYGMENNVTWWWESKNCDLGLEDCVLEVGTWTDGIFVT